MVNIKVNKKNIIVALMAVVVIVVIVLVTTKEGKKIIQPAPMITSTTPGDNSKYVVESSDLKIVFQNETTEKEKNDITIKSEPDARFASTWISDTTLKLTPPNNLENDTTYKISVVYKGDTVKTITFKTEKNSKEELANQAREQARYDYIFNEDLKKVFEEMPWLEKLPIENTNYRAVYDFDKNSLRIRLLIPSTASENEKENAKEAALESISNKISNVEEITYYFLYQDE